MRGVSSTAVMTWTDVLVNGAYDEMLGPECHRWRRPNSVYQHSGRRLHAALCRFTSRS